MNETAKGMAAFAKLERECFCERLRVAIAAHGMNRREAAELVGVHISTFGRWCRGDLVPTHEQKVAISEATGMPLDVLLKLSPVDLTRV